MKLPQIIIITFVVLNVCAIGSVSYFLINGFQETLTSAVLDDTEDELELKSQTLQNYLISNSDKIKLYTILPEIQGLVKFSEFGDSFIFDKVEWFNLIKTQFQEIVKTNNDIDQIRVLDKNGMEIIRINSDKNNLHVVSESDFQDKSDRYYFKDVITKPKNYVYLSDIDLNVENGEIESPHKTMLRFATSIVDGSGNQMGIMIVNHNMDSILSLIADISQGSMMIVDNNGQVIYSKDPSNLFGNQLQTNYNYFEKDDSILQILDTESMMHDKENQLYKFWKKIPSPSDPDKFWILITTIPQSVIVTPIQDAIVDSYYFVAAFVVGTLVITIIVSNRISKPLENLIEGIKLAQAGNYDTQIAIKGSNEINDIGESFNDLTATLQVLKQMSERFSDDLDSQLNEIKFMSDSLNESTSLMKIDLDGNRIFVNDNLCKLSGYSREELLGQNEMILKSGTGHQEFIKDMQDTILDGRVWTGDTKNKRRDNTTYWTKKIIIPKKDADGNVVEFLIIQTDITSEKEHQISLDNTLHQESQKRFLENEYVKMTYHDLLDPISVIHGDCELLKLKLLDSNFTKEQKTSINTLLDDANKLHKQMDYILNIYKINSHEITFKKSTFTAYLLIQNIILDYTTKTKEQRVTIVNDIDPMFKIYSDESYLTQVIDHLIQNAFDFVPNDGGVIRISAEIKDQNMIFSIHDNGAGFSLDEQNKLFKKFYEIDTSHSRKHKPFEIRLITCKGIIEELGGKIWMESHSGFGSSFYFQLPI